MGWVRHVACMGKKRNIGIWWENLKERDHSEGVGIIGWIKLTRNKMAGGDWFDMAWDTDERWGSVKLLFPFHVGNILSNQGSSKLRTLCHVGG